MPKSSNFLKWLVDDRKPIGEAVDDQAAPTEPALKNSLDDALRRLRELVDEMDGILAVGYPELEALQSGFSDLLTALVDAESGKGDTPASATTTEAFRGYLK